MLLEIGKHKRMPRLLTAHSDTLYQPLNGVTFQWQDRSETQVLDLSLGGVALSAKERVQSLKVGQIFEGRLKISTVPLPIPLKVRVISLTSRVVGFAFESMSSEGRLVIEQGVKEALILNSFREIPAKELPETDRALRWYHGAFDTNLLVWDESADRFALEIENLFLNYNHGVLTFTKTNAAHEGSKAYLTPYLNESAKVVMGASWLDRAIKVLESTELKSQIAPVLQKLRSMRVQ